ncbi:hypothetical protein Mmc1_3172 [Magnetococcus marinus MC-1]|uniref:Uncharacterized protein n=2 Tax=Magnetococcus TaxID=162171 RepID=A0LCG9_MAGMM|nr:hypothetical protein Mmc1_3172 [Magnetococcus marinus MC-1]
MQAEGVDFGKLALLCVGLALFYLITAIYMASGSDEKQVKQWPMAKAYGPITTTQENQVVALKAHIAQREGSWSYLEVELLASPTGPLITGFSGEMHFETGYDDEGRWEDRQEWVEQRLVIPQPGSYYLRFKGGGGVVDNATAPLDLTQLDLEIRTLRGGDRGFNIGVVILLLLGVGFNGFANVRAKQLQEQNP